MIVWYAFGVAMLYGAMPDILRGAHWTGGQVRAANAVVPLWPVTKVCFGLAAIILMPRLFAVLLDDPAASSASLNPITNMSAALTSLTHKN